MSDHEGEGLDLERWDDASLPGGSTFSYAVSDVFNQGILHGDADFHPSTGPRFAPQGGVPGQSQNRIPRAPVHAPQQHGRFGQPRNIPPRQTVVKPPVTKTTAQLQCETGQPPNGEYQMVTPTWRALLTMALKLDRAAQPHPQYILRDVMARNDTYIRKPEDQDQVLLIWGEASQVAETKGQLAQWEQDVRDSFAQPKQPLWYKGKALDGRAEHREDRQHQQRLFKRLIQKADIDYSFEAALLWPKELDIEQFESTNAEILDQLRGSFGCRISFPTSDTEHILIAAQFQTDALSLMTRMMNLIKETISRRDRLVMVNLVHIPDYDMYGDRVGLLDKDPKTGTYLPTLHGKPAADEEQLNKDRRHVHVSNRKKVKDTIDSSIKRLRISQHHVRMRIVFGELGFELFQIPSGGADTYSFEDFYTMVTKGRTKMTLNGLPVRQGEVTDLADVLDSMEAFSDCTEYYAAFFDFPGTSHNSVLRLETVFDQSGETDTESREKRWVELSDMVSRLQVSLLNFDIPDYQVTIDAFPLHVLDKATKAHMAAFQGNITMERPPNGIKSLPRRRVKHPSNTRGLQHVSELTMLKWRFKNTDGIFELRRKDIYDLRPGRESGSPAETRWHALYYYPEWDNLMSDFAHVKPGEDVRWIKAAASFFPEGGDQWTALPRGFKNFINEVEEIQDLLAEAISRVAKGKGKAKEVDRNHANGV